MRAYYLGRGLYGVKGMEGTGDGTTACGGWWGGQRLWPREGAPQRGKHEKTENAGRHLGQRTQAGISQNRGRP